MEINVNASMVYELAGQTDFLLQIEVADLADQKLQSTKL